MPRGGSKKGEHRGAAKKRTHPTPNEVMREAVLRPAGARGHSAKTIERRIAVARTINGHSGKVTDLTPKEVLLGNMHFFAQAAADWQRELLRLAGSKDPEDVRRISHAESEIERYRNLASEDAYKLAPYVHPRLGAVIVGGNVGESAPDIVRALLDDIDARQREPRVIEHDPSPK